MEPQITPESESQNSQIPPAASLQPPIGDLEAMKQRARELAIAQYYAQKQAQELNSEVKFTAPIGNPAPQPQVVYVRRNLTVAEILVILAISCGIVTGVQFVWNATTDLLPRLEVKIKQ